MGKLLNVAFGAMLAATSFSTSANAAKFTGEDVLKYCVSDRPNAPPGDRYEQDMVVACWANMLATIETAVLMGDESLICLPSGILAPDILLATVKYLKANPKQAKERASRAYVTVLAQKWPCRK